MNETVTLHYCPECGSRDLLYGAMIQFDSDKASLTIVELDESTVVCDKCGSEVEPAVAKLSRSLFPFGSGSTGSTARIYIPSRGSSLWCFRGGFNVATRRIGELIMDDSASPNR